MLKSSLVELLKEAREFKAKNFATEARGFVDGTSSPSVSMNGHEALAYLLGARIGYMSPLPPEQVTSFQSYYTANVYPNVIEIVDALNEVDPVLIRPLLDTARAVYQRRYNDAYSLEENFMNALRGAVPENKVTCLCQMDLDSSAVSFAKRILTAE